MDKQWDTYILQQAANRSSILSLVWKFAKIKEMVFEFVVPDLMGFIYRAYINYAPAV